MVIGKVFLENKSKSQTMKKSHFSAFLMSLKELHVEKKAISLKPFFQNLFKCTLFYLLTPVLYFLGLVWWWWWRNIKSCEGEMEGHWSWWLRCRWGWSMPCTFYTKFSVSKLMAIISVDRKNEVIVQVLMLPLICMCCILIMSFFGDTSFGCIIWYFSCMFLWGMHILWCCPLAEIVYLFLA